ncbi:hypothetical protein CANINC_002323 [Pichia inconspicua]|uniref:Mediator of RNA polymerase II transcription subunit 7 n=1 Tax=Pichia inconspicua TaxID=52247 RepID=A0A4T0X1Y4_9ASCO|nr:hypothetical protein CANINC_002323 [[Candida] inconspicua]
MNSEISALYPPPPPYYKLFTSENVLKFNELKEKGVSDDEMKNIENLRFLVPPTPPKGEQYRSFGELWWFEDKHVGLKESGVEQIYGDSTSDKENDKESQRGETTLGHIQSSKIDESEAYEEVFSQFRINELKKMTKSLLLNFLELVGLLAKNPLLSAKKIDQIRTILINIHHLLNSYRLHQSRESLILIMQEKLKDVKEEIININRTCKHVESQLDLMSKKIDQTYDSGRIKDSNHDTSLRKNIRSKDQLISDAITAILQHI